MNTQENDTTVTIGSRMNQPAPEFNTVITHGNKTLADYQGK